MLHKKISNTILPEIVIGALIGLFFLHPLSMLLTQMDMLNQNEFELNHFFFSAMGFYFMAIGVFLGLVSGLFRLKLNKKNNELLKQSEELKIISQNKNRLFAIVAHDLSNPFQVIISVTDLLLKKYESFDKSKTEELLLVMKDSVNKYNSLLANLLIWSNIQMKNFSFQPTQKKWSDLVESTLSSLTPMANQKNIELIIAISPDITCFVDENMMSTIVRNLVFNAIKFTPPGGIITVTSQIIYSSLQTTVADTGIGMTLEQVNNIFRIEKMVSTPGTQNEMGTGLGLIICKEFIQQHKGNITAKSISGNGSCFLFSIPHKDI